MKWLEPYTYKKKGHWWFLSTWVLIFDDNEIHIDSDFYTIKSMTNYCNAAYNLGYKQKEMEESLKK